MRAGALLLNLRSEISNLRFSLSAAPFHPSPGAFRFEISKSDSSGWSVLCCTCRRPTYSSRFPIRIRVGTWTLIRIPIWNLESGIWNQIRRPAVSGLAALWCSDFPLLRGLGHISLEMQTLVRKQRSPDLLSLARPFDYSKPMFNKHNRSSTILNCAPGAEALMQFVGRF